MAGLIGADPAEVIFTACGTESNNFAIKGLALAREKKGRHVIVSAIEHFSVLHSARTLEKWGFEVTEVPVDSKGRVDPDEVRKSIRKDTVLVSVMLANAEVGTIEPVREISEVVRDSNAVFHTDAVAAVGRIPVDVNELGADALSLAGNQFYGPQGAAALWVRKGVRIMPLLDGGVQEGGRRAGTENVAAIAGLGKAAELVAAKLESRTRRIKRLADQLLKRLPEEIDNVVITGPTTDRLPGHASFCVEFIEGESMLMLLNMQGVAVSSGSACTSKALKASHVLIAMGLPHELAQGSLVFGFSERNTRKDVDYVLDVFPPIVDRLREMSPLYAKASTGGKGGGAYARV